MSVRGIDGQIMIQRAPEAAKHHNDQAHRHDAFQKALAEQHKAKAEREAVSVPSAPDSKPVQLRTGQRQGKGRKQGTPKNSEIQKDDTQEALEEGARGVSIDIRI